MRKKERYKDKQYRNNDEWKIAEMYMRLIKKCEKCENEVLYNDTFFSNIPVVACPICGKRFYVPETMYKNLRIWYDLPEEEKLRIENGN
jgi:ribosomal protein S27E